MNSKDVRQWQYERGERRLPEAPRSIGNWVACRDHLAAKPAPPRPAGRCRPADANRELS